MRVLVIVIGPILMCIDIDIGLIIVVLINIYFHIVILRMNVGIKIFIVIGSMTFKSGEIVWKLLLGVSYFADTRGGLEQFAFSWALESILTA